MFRKSTVAALLFAFALTAQSVADEIVNYGYRVVNIYPHDRNAFTQGLFFRDGDLYESTGLYGSSSIRRVSLTTGEILRNHSLADSGDGQILSAAREGRFNVLHACGIPKDFDSFAAYPVHVLNWADRAGGPPIRDVIGKLKPVVCGGVDNLTTLPNGTPDQVAEEVQDALRQAGDRPMMISAGCTFDPECVAPDNLDAMVRAARGSRA